MRPGRPSQAPLHSASPRPWPLFAAGAPASVADRAAAPGAVHRLHAPQRARRLPRHPQGGGGRHVLRAGGGALHRGGRRRPGGRRRGCRMSGARQGWLNCTARLAKACQPIASLWADSLLGRLPAVAWSPGCLRRHRAAPPRSWPSWAPPPTLASGRCCTTSLGLPRCWLPQVGERGCLTAARGRKPRPLRQGAAAGCVNRNSSACLALHPSPRADVRVLSLGRADFTRLLGPLNKLLQSQAAAYDTPTAKISKVAQEGRRADASGTLPAAAAVGGMLPIAPPRPCTP